QRHGSKSPGTSKGVKTAPGELVCVHSARVKAVVAAGLEAGLFTSLASSQGVRLGVTLAAGSRGFDFLLGEGEDSWVVEVKSVTLALGGGQGAFPDAVSLRGQKHLRELIGLAQSGQRSCLLFCVMHSGIRRVRPADEIDPVYGELL